VREAESPQGNRVTYEADAADGIDGKLAVTFDPPSGSVFALGTKLVTAHATDRAGNRTLKTFAVTIRDTVKPVVTAPHDITISVCKLPNIGKATVFDVASKPDPESNAPALFPLGTTVVTWKATDPSGNVGTDAQRVTAELGDDASCCPAGTKIILGTSTGDVLRGTAGRDCILGRGGNDVIDALDGDDFISGGVGNDTIAAGFGNDLVNGGPGDDIIDAGPGDDRVNGGSDRDTIAAGPGSDTVDGGPDPDNCAVPPDGHDSVKGCP
jgi:Ca2+-binding RTX toxin-like protein